MAADLVLILGSQLLDEGAVEVGRPGDRQFSISTTSRAFTSPTECR